MTLIKDFNMFRLTTCSLCIAFCSWTMNARADWPQFLGPHGNGTITAAPKLVESFPTSGPKVLWRVAGGPGQSGFAIVAGRAYTMLLRDEQQVLIALNADNGQTIWSTPLAPQYTNSMGGDGPRATPTVVGDRVLAYTGEGILVAADVADGHILWKQNLPQTFATKPAEYGMASSPLVVGDTAVVTVGGAQATVVAVDLKSGDIRWKAGSGSAGYSTPAVLKINDQPQLVAVAGKQVLGLAPTTGKVLWSYPYATPYDCNSATPIEIDGDVLISSGENHGSVRLKISKQGNDYQVSEVWQSFGGQASLRSEWQTPLRIGDYVYGFDNVGSAGAVTHLSCIDAHTGKNQWKKTRFGKANAILVDGQMIAANMKGELILGQLTPDGYNETDRAKVIDSTRQAPAFDDGKVYLRDNREFVCIDLRSNQ